MKGTSRKLKRLKLAVFGVLVIVAAGSAALNLGLFPGKRDASAYNRHPRQHHHYSRVLDPTMGQPPLPKPSSSSIANAAYETISPELPTLGKGGVRDAHQSVLDPSWASVRVQANGKDGYYAVFLHKTGDIWHPERSVLVQQGYSLQDASPKDVKAVVEDLPKDLTIELSPSYQASSIASTPEAQAIEAMEQDVPKDGKWKATAEKNSGRYHVVQVQNEKHKTQRTRVYITGEKGDFSVAGIGQNLTSADLPDFPEKLVKKTPRYTPEQAHIEPAKPVFHGDVHKGRVGRGLKKAERYVKNYPGIAGFYVLDLKSGSGYGVRPDEPFFSASVIKVAVMVAVYRRIDEGKLHYKDKIKIKKQDKAPGSGNLQWEPAGTPHSVEDYLWLMITRSDNVATNVLTRAVGGRDYVNKVARSLGARDTVLYQKLSDNRAAVPSLDNRTTPHDMATILAKIYEGKAASRQSCKEMVDLLRHNNMEWWMEAGVPPSVKVANKGGWLDSTFNDAGIVEYKKRPYVLAIFTQYGPNNLQQGGNLLADVSRSIWLAQSGETLYQYERGQRPQKPSRQHKEKPHAHTAGQHQGV